MADERDLLEFDTEYVLSEIFPETLNAPEARRKCSVCGADSRAWSASALTVVKRHHGTQPLGHLIVYCPEHIARANEWESSGGSGKFGPICPNCHMAIPVGSLECDVCGWTPLD